MNGSAPKSGIDHAAIEPLRVDTPDLWKRLVIIYLESTPDELTTLKQAIAAKDGNAVYLAAHSLKSSSANMGALRLAHLCQLIETVAGDQNLESLSNMFAEISSEYQFVSTELAQDIDGTAAP
jgi:HPt (histidine-containing phosphotransfer) domain-containing protein